MWTGRRVQFEVSAFDADDQFGTDLTIHGQVGQEQHLFQIVVVKEMNSNSAKHKFWEYVTKFPVTVTITDAHGGQVSETIIVDIWNNQVAVGTTDRELP